MIRELTSYLQLFNIKKKRELKISPRAPATSRLRKGYIFYPGKYFPHIMKGCYKLPGRQKAIVYILLPTGMIFFFS